MKAAVNMTILALAMTVAWGARAETQGISESIKIYGTIDLGLAYGHAEKGGIGQNTGKAASTWAVDGNNLTTSFIGFSGGEELGDGYKASFKMEGFFRADTGGMGRNNGDVLFGRESYVGIDAPWGALRAGKPLTPFGLSMLMSDTLGFSSKFDPLFAQLYTVTLNSAGPNNTSYVGNSIPFDAEWSNAVTYTSPDFNGLSFGLGAGFGEVAGSTGKMNLGGNVLYFSGPLMTTFAVQRLGMGGGNTNGGTWPSFYPTPNSNYPNPNDGSVIGDYGFASRLSYQMSYLLGVSYDLQVVKLFGQYAQVDNEMPGGASGQHNHYYVIGAKVPFGKGYFRAAWARGYQSSFGNSAIPFAYLAKGYRDTASVVYNYPLSKRTDLYAGYRFDKFSAQDAAYNVSTNLQTNVSSNYVAIGMRHSF